MHDAVITAVSGGLGLGVSAYGVLLFFHIDRKLRQRGCLVAASGSAITLTGSAVTGLTPIAAVNAAACAVWLWLWWNNGGGDGLRRLGRSIRDSLTPAPQTT